MNNKKQKKPPENGWFYNYSEAFGAFFVAGFFATGFFAAGFFSFTASALAGFGSAGLFGSDSFRFLVTPYDPMTRFPFAVFLSPFPMLTIFY
jgi:hypothetical protein